VLISTVGEQIMPEVITYKVHSGNPKPGFEWTAYVVLPNGEYWGVRFNGSTEELAKSKAIALWTKEQERFKRFAADDGGPAYDSLADDEIDVSEKHDRRGAHFAGKAWLIHKVTRKKLGYRKKMLANI
jgi:hypothetical protein